MIQKYFMIVTKDKEGFTVPYVNVNSVPELFNDEERANDTLRFIKRTFQSKIDYVAEKPNFRVFRSKNEQPRYSEEQKKEMRWFIAHASVKGVTLHL